jgi:hypothetical protein
MGRTRVLSQAHDYSTNNGFVPILYLRAIKTE